MFPRTAKSVWSLAILLVFAAAAGAEDAVNTDQKTAAATAAPAAPADTATPPAMPAPSPVTATVILFRPSRFVGSAVDFIVREGETELGMLRSGSYFAIQVTPGKHTFAMHSEAKEELTTEAGAGETYYIEGTVGVGD